MTKTKQKLENKIEDAFMQLNETKDEATRKQIIRQLNRINSIYERKYNEAYRLKAVIVSAECYDPFGVYDTN